MATIDKVAAEKALERVRRTQSEFWSAMSELESELGVADLDSARDYEEMTIEDLLEEEAGPAPCAKCGKLVEDWFSDVDDMGKLWKYCSMECLERH